MGEGNTPHFAIIQEIIYFLQIRFMLELLLHLDRSHDVSPVSVFLCNHLHNADPCLDITILPGWHKNQTVFVEIYQSKELYKQANI